MTMGLSLLLWFTGQQLQEAQEDFNDWQSIAASTTLATAHDHEVAKVASELQAINKQFDYLATSKTVAEALNDLKWGFNNLDPRKAGAFGSAPLKTYYQSNDFEGKDDLLEAWFPSGAVATYLQSFYVAGQRSWDKSHPFHYIPEFYGPDLRAQLDLLQATSLWIIGPEGHVLYGENPGPLLGNSLLKTPYSEAPAGQLLEDILTHQKFRLRQAIHPISGQPQLVAGAPIVVEGKTAGFIIAALKKSALPSKSGLSRLSSHLLSWEPLDQGGKDTLVSQLDWNGHEHWLSTWTTP